MTISLVRADALASEGIESNCGSAFPVVQRLAQTNELNPSEIVPQPGSLDAVPILCRRMSKVKDATPVPIPAAPRLSLVQLAIRDEDEFMCCAGVRPGVESSKISIRRIERWLKIYR